MKNIKKGDIVSRASYNNDIYFYVSEINETNTLDNRSIKIATLKGITYRIEADSPLEDLVVSNEKRSNFGYDQVLFELSKIYSPNRKFRYSYGKILHLDGDRGYSIKTEKYYRKKGLNYVVKHVAEQKQPELIYDLLYKHNPDIVVFTGHDGMIKRGKNYNDINNYRNSKYFIKAVSEARRVFPRRNDLVIFAGACQSYYEAIMAAGANFASSPDRILIDFMDPLVIAEAVAITAQSKFVTMDDLEHKIRNGLRAVNGVGAVGKMVM